jgi:prepilin-type N-terminal cleavage/methylation domain-containing protein
MPRKGSSRGFTLIELLVVIAIIAIMSATLMPAVSSSLNRSRMTQCRSNLTHIGIALRMYHSDHGAYPPTLGALVATDFITDVELTLCTKTGAEYHYRPPTSRDRSDASVAACVSPDTTPGKRPHSFRNSLLILQKGGRILERRK